jgi:hypothetical protein
MGDGLGGWLGLGLGLAIGAGGCALWMGQRLKAALARQQHLEQCRTQEQQHTTAARRQMEVLQKELAELRHLLARRGQSLPARESVSELPPEAFEPTDSGELDDGGFQRTQLIPGPGL